MADDTQRGKRSDKECSIRNRIGQADRSIWCERRERMAEMVGPICSHTSGTETAVLVAGWCCELHRGRVAHCALDSGGEPERGVSNSGHRAVGCGSRTGIHEVEWKADVRGKMTVELVTHSRIQFRDNSRVIPTAAQVTGKRPASFVLCLKSQRKSENEKNYRNKTHTVLPTLVSWA